MIRRIVSFAVHQPLFVFLLTGLFLLGGILAFQSLPIEAFPDVTDIQVTVITLYPGYAAEEVEKQVTTPLEIGLSGLPNAVRMFSHTQFGLSFLIVTLDRKSTRLNSSHDQISYAVFCLKKKKKTNTVREYVQSPSGRDCTCTNCKRKP